MKFVISAEIVVNPAWRVSAGESSKEVEVQKNRIRREKETLYEALQDIASNPKEPWDLEMDYDDSLTPVISIEQPPDADAAAESPVPPERVVVGLRETEKGAAVAALDSEASSSSQAGNPSSTNNSGLAAQPDFELLSVLLKNPELVFALMNGQAGSLTSEDTVRLLDLIKANGVASLGTLNGMGRKAEEKVEVSLPSPTPSSNPVRVPVRDLMLTLQHFVRNYIQFSSFLESNSLFKISYEKSLKCGKPKTLAPLWNCLPTFFGPLNSTVILEMLATVELLES